MFSILALKIGSEGDKILRKKLSRLTPRQFFSRNFVTLVANFEPKLKTWSRQIMFYTKKCSSSWATISTTNSILQVGQSREMLVMARCKGVATLQQVFYRSFFWVSDGGLLIETWVIEFLTPIFLRGALMISIIVRGTCVVLARGPYGFHNWQTPVFFFSWQWDHWPPA